MSDLRVVTSPFIIEEVNEVIRCERIIKLTKMSPSQQSGFIDKLIERSDLTAGKQLVKPVGRDSKDDKFLACAIEARVDYLVTGDEDLLVLKKYEGIKIVTPRQFLEILNR